MRWWRNRKFPSLNQSYRLLKVRWQNLALLDQWRHMRTVAGHEHLHFRIPRHRRVASGPLLRMRRLAVAHYFVTLGYEVDRRLLSSTLPKGPSGTWLEEICPHAGPKRSSGVVPAA
jgi:hypothetical protein